VIGHSHRQGSARSGFIGDAPSSGSKAAASCRSSAFAWLERQSGGRSRALALAWMRASRNTPDDRSGQMNDERPLARECLRFGDLPDHGPCSDDLDNAVLFAGSPHERLRLRRQDGAWVSGECGADH
jgi:hypothetical protein